MPDTFPPQPTDSRYPPVAEHTRLYATTGGREGHLWNGAPTLLLTTTGRHSGLPRRTALIYGRHGDDHLVVASNLGADQHPDWYLNLCHTPTAHIQVRNEHLDVSARTATDSERAELWQLMTSLWDDYDRYQQSTERRIPVVILQPAGSHSTPSVRSH